MTTEAVQDKVDTRALETAVRAETKINSHEKICSERYKEITDGQKGIFHQIEESNDKLDESNSQLHEKIDSGYLHINEKIDNQNVRWLTVAGMIIILLLTMSGFLITKLEGW